MMTGPARTNACKPTTPVSETDNPTDEKDIVISRSAPIIERVLAVVGTFFSAARVIRVPLALTAIGAALLAGPPQTREVYRVIAQDWWYGYTFRCGGSLLSMECPHFILFREMLFSYLGILGTALAIWYSACRAGSTFWPRSPEAHVERTILRSAPTILAFSVIIAAAWGVFASIPFEPDSHNASTLKAIAEHKWVAKYGTQPDAAEVNLMMDIIKFLILPAGVMQAMAGSLVITAICLLIFLGRLLHPRDLWPATRWENSGPILAFVGLVIVFLAVPVAMPRWIGPIGVLGLFLICATSILTQLSMQSSRLKIPFIFVLFCWIIFLSWTGVNNNHVVNLGAPPPSEGGAQIDGRRALRDIVKEWYDSRPDKNKYESAGTPYPVYIVAAQGGGIYAAYNTASLLGSLEDRCPTFAWHNFAISGVSGGSVGASVFVSLLKRKQVEPNPCKPDMVTNSQLLLKDSMVDQSGRILDQDYLSPLLSGLLFGDLLQAVLPVPIPILDRARALDSSLEVSFENPTFIGGDGSRQGSNFANPLLQAFTDHWNPRAGWPALILNTTDVQTGQRRVMAPFQVGDNGDQFLPVWPGEVLAGVKLSTGAFLSARFPWVTPSGWYKSASGGVTYLVDGGYYDNSGLATAREVMEAIDQAGLGGRIVTKLIILTGAPGEPGPMRGLNDVLDPIRAMLNTWGVRPIEAIRSADQTLNNSSNSRYRARIVHLRGLLYGLPLGWRLSGGTAYIIDAEDPVPGLCKNDTKEDSANKLFEADCLLQDLERELQ